MAMPRKTSLMISLVLFLILYAAATAHSVPIGGLAQLGKQAKRAFDLTLGAAEASYELWKADHDNLPQNDVVEAGCWMKFNDTVNSLADSLIDLSSNGTSSTTGDDATKNVTSYIEGRVNDAESKRIRCVTTSLGSNDSQALTTHFALSLASLLFLLFSAFSNLFN